MGLLAYFFAIRAQARHKGYKPAWLTAIILVGIHANMKATLLFRDKKRLANGTVMEMVVWELRHPTADRPHGLKYR